MTPSVTVFVPTKNAAAYIAETLNSLQQQSYGSFKVAVFDGGSSDPTVEIVRSFAEQDTRFEYKIVEGSSVNQRANLFLKELNPDIFINAHADDINFPDRIAKQVEYFSAHPKAAMIGSAAKFWLHDPENCDSRNYSGLNEYPLTHEDIVVRLPFWWCFATPSVAVNSRLMRQNGVLLDEKLTAGGDWELYWRLSKIGRLANFDFPLVSVRHHHASDGAQNSDSIKTESRQIREIIAAEIGISRHLSPAEMATYLDIFVEYDWLSRSSKNQSTYDVLKKLEGASEQGGCSETLRSAKDYLATLSNQIMNPTERPNKLVSHWENLISERDRRIAELTDEIGKRDKLIEKLDNDGRAFATHMQNEIKKRDEALSQTTLRRLARRFFPKH